MSPTLSNVGYDHSEASVAFRAYRGVGLKRGARAEIREGTGSSREFVLRPDSSGGQFGQGAPPSDSVSRGIALAGVWRIVWQSGTQKQGKLLRKALLSSPVRQKL